jgi:DNA invertase Pin-like site-specific DNA recombinase
MKIYGYIRVSTSDQNEDRQLHAMRDCGVPSRHIYTDKMSGADFNRPRYQALVKRLKQGDLVYIKSIDRMGRDYAEIQEQWRLITKVKGADIVVLDMPLLDTRRHKDLLGTLIADLVLQVLSFMAQSERDLIRQRQAEGIKSARLRGVHLGRPAKELPENFVEIVNLWECKKLKTKDVLKLLELPESTFYRRYRKYKSSMNE